MTIASYIILGIIGAMLLAEAFFHICEQNIGRVIITIILFAAGFYLLKEGYILPQIEQFLQYCRNNILDLKESPKYIIITLVLLVANAIAICGDAGSQLFALFVLIVEIGLLFFNPTLLLFIIIVRLISMFITCIVKNIHDHLYVKDLEKRHRENEKTRYREYLKMGNLKYKYKEESFSYFYPYDLFFSDIFIFEMLFPTLLSARICDYSGKYLQSKPFLEPKDIFNILIIIYSLRYIVITFVIAHTSGLSIVLSCILGIIIAVIYYFVISKIVSDNTITKKETSKY